MMRHDANIHDRPLVTDYSMLASGLPIKEEFMNCRSSAHHYFTAIVAISLWCISFPLSGWGLDVTQRISSERRETVSLADAAVRALQNNLDISISRHNKESRLADIIIEYSKFDPNVSLNGQYARTVNPLNRPVFGGTGNLLNQITPFDQRSESFTFDAQTNLITGGNFDMNYSPARTNVNANVARGFLFNPSWTGGLAFTLTQPLLKNAGIEINRTFIKVAQNNAEVEQHVFRDRVLTVITTVEQTYWELVFANENLKVAQAAMKAAEELLASNRAKSKAGVMSIVDVLQAEAA